MAKTSPGASSASSDEVANSANSSVQTSAPTDPAAVLPPWIDDEHAGIGGDYVFDPATGKRTRVGGADLPESAA